MYLSKHTILFFRIAFILALLIATYFAVNKTELHGMENINDKVSHFLAFFMLAFLLDFSYPKHRFTLWKFLFLIGYGLLIEVIQLFLPYRDFSLLDWLADGIGVTLYVVSIPALKYFPVLRLRWKKNLETE